MIEIISHTGIGKRKENQDVILINNFVDHNSLYLIVDGMGGYDNGKDAAELIANSISNYLSNSTVYNSFKIEEAIKKANLEVKLFNDKYNSKSGGTLGGILKTKEKSILFWIGDVSIFLYKEDNIIFKSKSHTLINDMKDLNADLTPSVLEKYKHVVTKSISGKRELISMGIYELVNNKFDKFLICSDGVLDVFNEFTFFNISLDFVNSNLQVNSKDNYSYIVGNNLN